MRTSILILVGILSACASKGFMLDPPSGRSDQSAIGADMNKCLQAARTPREITAAERAALADKPTDRFFMNGRPVVNTEGKPALHMGAFSSNSSSPFADRYALCLLSQGYTWRER
jgi:hypothetical protein